MDLFEKTVSQEIKFEGRIIDVRHDVAQLSDGREVQREVVLHPGGVAIALEDDDNTFFLVEQFRYGQQRTLIEFPAGKKEKGEDPFETAKREIVEEVGYEGIDYYYLGELVPTGAYLTEKIAMYYAKKGNQLGQHLDDDEQLNVSKKTIDELVDLIMDGTIIDAKTIAMTFMIKQLKEKGII